jgi:hypothetical protein
MSKIVFTPGLGNQLFQYIVGYMHSRETATPLTFSIDRTFSKNDSAIEISKIFHPFDFSFQNTTVVEQFIVDIYKKSDESDSRLFPLLFGEKEFKARKFKIGSLVYGFYLSYEWMNSQRRLISQIIKYDTNNNVLKKYSLLIKKSKSIGIHIRRGDYTNPNAKSYHGLLEFEYYLDALKFLGTHDKTIFVFSDDIEFCKSIFSSIKADFIYVENQEKSNNWVDIILMSMCDELIIANSTFSWWGAFLKSDKGRIVAPKLWFCDREAQLKFSEVHSDAWVLL